MPVGAPHVAPTIDDERGVGGQGARDSTGDLQQRRALRAPATRPLRAPTTTMMRRSTLRSRALLRQSYDDDTASSGAPDPDWGDATDYQNQQVYAAPYAYPYRLRRVGARAQRESAIAGSRVCISLPMSSPITQAARPPLNPGPWMNPPTMSAFGRPAGSPMMGMASQSVRISSLTRASQAVSFPQSSRAIIFARSRRYTTTPSVGEDFSC